MDALNGEDSVRGFDLLKPFGKAIYFGMHPIYFLLYTFIYDILHRRSKCIRW